MTVRVGILRGVSLAALLLATGTVAADGAWTLEAGDWARPIRSTVTPPPKAAWKRPR